MPKFITIGYGDREGYDRTAKTVRDVAHAHDEVLQKGGALMGIAVALPYRFAITRLKGYRRRAAPIGLQSSRSLDLR